MKRADRRFWFHPLLFAVYPAVSLLAANDDQVPLAQGLRFTFASLLLGMLVYAAARWALRREDTAPLVASLILMASLSYGRLYDGLKDLGLSGETLVRHRYLLPAYAAAQLDQTITPVNSSRVIFDAVYGGSYGQLPNVSYFSTEAEESEFAIVPNTWASSMP